VNGNIITGLTHCILQTKDTTSKLALSALNIFGV